MSDQFVGEIRIFGCNFAPFGWATCQGQLLPISQNTALFSLLGTTYGGDGKSNFALPDLQGRIPLHYNQGPGLSDVVIGEAGGTETVTLLPNQVASHSHMSNCTNSVGTSYDPASNVWATDAGGNNEYGSGVVAGQMATGAIHPAGGGQPHDNLQPFLVMTICIALQGIFPARS